jgi:hypothetical protein
MLPAFAQSSISLQNFVVADGFGTTTLQELWPQVLGFRSLMSGLARSFLKDGQRCKMMYAMMHTASKTSNNSLELGDLEVSKNPLMLLKSMVTSEESTSTTATAMMPAESSARVRGRPKQTDGSASVLFGEELPM